MWIHDQITSHAIASKYIAHGKTAVVVFVEERLPTIHDQNVKEIRIRTDGLDIII